MNTHDAVKSNAKTRAHAFAVNPNSASILLEIHIYVDEDNSAIRVKIGSKGERGNGGEDGLAGGDREHHADILIFCYK